ncbi:MAG: Wzz/FepE/Etk N-terminal domain-containing protein [Flavobacteriaceae bacterium]|nr:Wzz/FepE/Etk N-terminal domain-containing protein [Flavobacteriaceae bacterium]
MNLDKNNLAPINNTPEGEVDMISVVKTLWGGKRLILKSTLFFLFLGLIVALFSQKEFTSTSTIFPQTTDSKKIGGNLSGLAAMAGINLGSFGGDSGIPSTLYPQIITSTPFQRELFDAPLTIEGYESPITFEYYYQKIYKPGILGYIKKYTIGLPRQLTKLIKGKSAKDNNNISNNRLYIITENDKELIERINDQITLIVNVKDGYITISASMPEALASAQLAEYAQNLLQKYIINFKIQKSANQLRFVEERFKEKENEFKLIQHKLASFRDRNQFINSSLTQSTLERLQSEYDLAFNVYSELAKQIETQQIQVKEDTPIFTILKPVSVPIEKSKPNRLFILFIYTFLGGISGIGWVFWREFLSSVKERWDDKN